MTRRGSRGASLLEVLLAIFVIAGPLLAVMGTLTRDLSLTTRNRGDVLGLITAKKWMETYTRSRATAIGGGASPYEYLEGLRLLLSPLTLTSNPSLAVPASQEKLYIEQLAGNPDILRVTVNVSIGELGWTNKQTWRLVTLIARGGFDRTQ